MEKDINDLEKEVPFERSEWPVLRLGWIAMGLFLLCGASGLLGTGLLSSSSVNMNDISVSYEKYLRYSVKSEITIEVPQLGPDSSLWINSDYTKKVTVVSISPQPVSVDQKDGLLRVKFPSRTAKEITVYIQPEKGGSQNLDIILNGKTSSLSQYIYL